jgi:hypothetical protein
VSYFFQKASKPACCSTRSGIDYYDVLVSVVNLASRVPQKIMKLAAVALDILNNVGNQRSALEASEGEGPAANDQHLTSIAQRDPPAEATPLVFSRRANAETYRVVRYRYLSKIIFHVARK